MNNDLTYDQILDRLPAYVMGALEPDEMLAVEAYLGQQQALLTRLQDSEEAAAQLAHLAPPVPLPATAKERLLQRVQTDLAARQAAETATEVTTDQIQPRPAAVKPTPAATPPAHVAGPGRRLTGIWASFRTFRTLNGWTVATAGAVVALIVVLLYTGQMQSRLSQVETRLDELQQTNRILQLQLQTEQERLAFTVSAPNRIVLPGTAEAPNARGLVYLGHNDQALLALSGLPPLSTQQTYQLWLIPADQAPIPAGLLTVDAEPTTWVMVQLPPGVQSFTAVGVSVEPAGGSPAPTGPIVLLGETTS